MIHAATRLSHQRALATKQTKDTTALLDVGTSWPTQQTASKTKRLEYHHDSCLSELLYLLYHYPLFFLLAFSRLYFKPS